MEFLPVQVSFFFIIIFLEVMLLGIYVAFTFTN